LNDTTATGANLNTLTDTSNADGLHSHASSALTGFTQYYVPFGNAAGGLTEDINFTWNGSKLWLYGGGVALETTGSIKANAADLYLTDNTARIFYGNNVSSNPYWVVGWTGGNYVVEANAAGAGNIVYKLSDNAGANVFQLNNSNSNFLYSIDSLSRTKYLAQSIFYPSADHATAFNFNKADASTSVMSLDTISGILTVPGTIKGGIIATDNFRNYAGTESIIWNNGSTRWQFSDDIYITGGLTISAFGTAGFVKNTVAGVLSGGNTISVGDITDIATNYLKLDCSNDPLTNTLNGANLDFTGTANIDSTLNVGGIIHCDDKVEFTSTDGYIDEESW